MNKQPLGLRAKVSSPGRQLGEVISVVPWHRGLPALPGPVVQCGLLVVEAAKVVAGARETGVRQSKRSRDGCPRSSVNSELARAACGSPGDSVEPIGSYSGRPFGAGL